MAVKFANWLLLTAVVSFLASCTTTSRTDFPVTDVDQAELHNTSVNIIQITPQNIGSYRDQKRVWHPDPQLPVTPNDWLYLVGIGDVLSITVWDHPELTLPAGPDRSQIESGSSVNANGEIFYPYIGNLKAAGRSVGDIQNELTERLAEYIPDPQIEVKVAAFNSQKVVVTGGVATPTTLGISNIPLTLIEAINAAGGLREDVDGRHVTIRRSGQTYYVNLRAFLDDGRAGNNPVLHGGDIVNVPLFRENFAYILGQIENPGLVDLGADGTTLTEAIAERGGLVEESADSRGVFVFRSNPTNTGFDVFQLDATTPLAFVLATEFALHPKDVVYVVTDPAARWNAVVNSLIPSILAVGSVVEIGNDLE